MSCLSVESTVTVPQTIMWFTWSTSTANWTTDNTLKSPALTTFAIFRCTNRSPGNKSRTVVSGTRESEHPIHKIWGCWLFAKLGKSNGFSRSWRSAHVRLRSRRVVIGVCAVYRGKGSSPSLGGVWGNILVKRRDCWNCKLSREDNFNCRGKRPADKDGPLEILVVFSTCWNVPNWNKLNTFRPRIPAIYSETLGNCSRCGVRFIFCACMYLQCGDIIDSVTAFALRVPYGKRRRPEIRNPIIFSF